jgi:hypothetical protein
MKSMSLATRVTARAAALVILISGPAFAVPQDYSYELVQVAPAGSGKFEVIVQLDRTSDGAPVPEAIISVNRVDTASADGTERTGKAVDTAAGQPGRHRFRIETDTAGTWVLHLSAKVPRPDRVDRMFFPSVKWTQVLKVHRSEVVGGAVTFVAQ